MSFAAKVIGASATPIHYIWGEDAMGESHYWFVMCSAQKYAALKSQFGSGVKIQDYGIIVAEGTGNKPSVEVKKMLIEKYGFNPDEHFSYS